MIWPKFGMGAFTSRDTRRISFDNTFELNSALAIRNNMPDENVMEFENLTPAAGDAIIFKEINKTVKEKSDVEDDDMNYWSQRIENLKKEHQIINQIVETEYDEKIKSTNQIIEAPKITHNKIQKIKPCFDWRAKIIQCYEDNPRQPLMCSAMVQAFNDCVTACRIDD